MITHYYLITISFFLFLASVHRLHLLLSYQHLLIHNNSNKSRTNKQRQYNKTNNNNNYKINNKLLAQNEIQMNGMQVEVVDLVPLVMEVAIPFPLVELVEVMAAVEAAMMLATTVDQVEVVTPSVQVVLVDTKIAMIIMIITMNQRRSLSGKKTG